MFPESRSASNPNPLSLYLLLVILLTLRTNKFFCIVVNSTYLLMTKEFVQKRLKMGINGVVKR